MRFCRNKNHVGVSRQNPTACRIAPAQPHVSCKWLQYSKVGLFGKPPVLGGANSQNTDDRLGFFSQRISNRFYNGWQIVWCVVVDKDNFVRFSGEEGREAIEADGKPFVIVIAVVVVSAVHNNREHVSMVTSLGVFCNVWDASINYLHRTCGKGAGNKEAYGVGLFFYLTRASVVGRGEDVYGIRIGCTRV